MPIESNPAPVENAKTKYAQRETEIALAMKQEAERHKAAIKNMHRLRALRLSRANGQVVKAGK